MPSNDTTRAVAVAALVLLAAVTGAAAFATTAAAVDDADLWVEDSSPGAATNHHWSGTIDGAAAGDVAAVHLNYSGTGANLSAVEAFNVSGDVNGEFLAVDAVTASDGDQVLEIDLFQNVTVGGGESINVSVFDQRIVNPAAEGSYDATIELYDDQGTQIDDGTTTFSIATPTGAVEGEVFEKGTYAPIEGATVTLLDGEAVVAEAVTNDTGYYHIEHAEGTYGLETSADGYEANATTVTLTQGMPTYEYPELEPLTGTLAGQVTDAETGDPVAGATVDAFEGEYWIADATTDGDGNYSLTVPVGTYDVDVAADGYALAQDTGVTVAADATTDHDVSLVAEGGEGGGGGEGGDLGNVTITDVQLTYANGTAVPSLSVENTTTNLLNVHVVDGIDQDISAVVDGDTRLRLSFRVEGFSPDVLIGTAENVTWSTERVGENTTDVTVEGTPGSAQYLFFENGTSPTIHDWPESEGQDVATDAFEQMFDVAFVDLERSFGDAASPPPLANMTIATDAQSFTVPHYDEVTGELSIGIAGPHFETDGVTVNDGFFEAYLPAALIEAWGVEDPAELTGAYQGEETELTVTESDRGDGWDLSVDVHYSAGSVSVAPASDDGGDEEEEEDDGSSGGGGGGGYVPPPSDGDDGDDEEDEDAVDDEPVEEPVDDEGDRADDDRVDDGDEAGDGTTEGDDAGEGDGTEDDRDGAGDGAETDDSTADDASAAAEDDETPGFGLALALLALLTAAAVRVHERRES